MYALLSPAQLGSASKLAQVRWAGILYSEPPGHGGHFDPSRGGSSIFVSLYHAAETL
jgi:hypothetical protein